MEAVAPVIAYLASLSGATVYAMGFAVLLLCGLGLPVPEDITLLLMGYMTWLPLPDGSPRPYADVGVAVAVGLAGVMIGDGFMFTLGRRLGVRLVDRWPFSRILGGGRLEKAADFLRQHGAKVLFSARFMPGLRSVVFFTSGTLGISLGRFLLYDGLAALLSVPALVVSAWYWGAEFQMVVDKARQAEHGVLIVIMTVAGLWLAKSLWSRRRATNAAPRADERAE